MYKHQTSFHPTTASSNLLGVDRKTARVSPYRPDCRHKLIIIEIPRPQPERVRLRPDTRLGS